jgi:type II secretory pathway component GspD/PulD (secretin)
VGSFAAAQTPAPPVSPTQVSPTQASPTESPTQASVPASVDERSLEFAFSATPWREVIVWLAEEAGLALHVGDLPTGSFTYSDPSAFTPQEAIDRVNLFLLPQGFTLVRNGGLLSLINLADPRGLQQLDAIADWVPVELLEERPGHDMVKCVLPLGDISAEDAVRELSVLQLISSPQVLTKTNQLLITDTVKKLRNVKAVLDAFQPSAMENGTVVQSFPLQHISAEDFLVVARPHLGLATDEMIGIDVSLSADLSGKTIFVTGVEDKVKLLEGLVKAMDQPDRDGTTSAGAMELRSHAVSGGNLNTVYNVLQTLLAGKTVRLSMDDAAGSLVAWAEPEVQENIAQTIAQLQAAAADFEVIPLKNADPYLVISLLEQLLDLPGPLDDPEEIDPDAPKIDADPQSMRLFVRAKKSQLEQIKKIVEGLDVVSSSSGGDVRIVPLLGAEAERMLETAAKFWRGENPVVLLRSATSTDAQASERVVHARTTLTVGTRRGRSLAAAAERDERWLTPNTDSQTPAIRCQVTSRGLLLQSDDLEGLDRFEEHLRLIANPVAAAPSPPIVFYLRYAKAEDALRMLAEMLQGGESAGAARGGSLVNGYVSSADSWLGSFVTSRDGTTTMTTGSITIVADSRLNRLIAQGTTSEVEQIENYLTIIDKDQSITTVETHGTSNVIELFHTKASEVAAAIREAYADRVATAATDRGDPSAVQQGGQRENAPVRQEEANPEANSRRTGGQKPATPAAKSLEPKMTIAVHEPSNSLIVTAPEQLFLEVERLAKVIDSRGEQTVQVITPINAAVFDAVLQQLLLGKEVDRSDRSRTLSSSRAPSSGRSER